jgi:TolB-like protein/Tfp pilus assembly protein PilF
MVKDFLHELQRRNVFPILASYAVIGWVVVQVLSIIPQALGLPDWILTLASVLFLAFFPVIIFISWFFDVSLDGITLTPVTENVEATGVGKKYWIGFVVTLLLSTTLGFYGYQHALINLGENESRLMAVTKQQSIAILPFEDTSPNSDQRYLAQGVPEEITKQLGTFSELTVASSISSAAFAKKFSDPAAIAKSLGVSNLLTGTIRQTGDLVKITVKLLNGANGEVLWSKSFSRKIVDIFAVEEEISRSIVNLLFDNYLSQGEVNIASKTASSDAFVLYLQAQENLRIRTTESIQLARKLFEQSLGIDPEYSNAQVGLAQSYILLANNPQGFGVLDVEVALTLAKRNLEKALARTPNLPEAQATMGLVFAHEFEHEKALVLYEKAIALNPSYSTAYLWKGSSLETMQKNALANDSFETAYKLDPAYPPVMLGYARTLYIAGNLKKAKTIYDDILSLYPNSPMSNRGLAEIAFSQGDLVESALQWKTAVEKSPKSEQYRISLINVLFQIQAADIAKRYIQSDEWEVNLLIAEGKFEQVHELMAFKLKANPNDKWIMYEAAWYQYLYGDIAKGKDVLINAKGLFAEEELFYPPLCNPAMEIAFAYKLNNNVEEFNRLLAGCKDLHENMLASEGVSDALHYLNARVAVLENNNERAVNELMLAYRNGWREHWSEYDPILASIKDDPRVIKVFELIKDDLNNAKIELQRRL